MSGDLDQTHTLYLGATPRAVWSALTDPEVTPRWFHGLRVQATWQAGGTVQWSPPGSDRAAVHGEILEIEPERDLLHSFHLSANDDPATRVRVRLEAEDGGICRLVLTHVGFDERNETWHQVSAGWPRALSALKTWLETGKELGAST